MFPSRAGYALRSGQTWVKISRGIGSHIQEWDFYAVPTKGTFYCSGMASSFWSCGFCIVTFMAAHLQWKTCPLQFGAKALSGNTALNQTKKDNWFPKCLMRSTNPEIVKQKEQQRFFCHMFEPKQLSLICSLTSV